MIEKATSAANIQSMLATMRAMQSEAAGAAGAGAGLPGATQEVAAKGFADLVKNAVGQVNDAQVQARSLQDAYERGEPVPLTDVVLGMQKSSLAFEATLQIRNKVLKAYEEVLNMPV